MITSWYSSKSGNQTTLCVSDGMLMPVLWVVWFHWDLYLVDLFCLCPGSGIVSWGIIGCLCPGCGRAVFFSPLLGVWACVNWLVCMLAYMWGMVCGLSMDALSMGLVFFCWFAFWHMLDFLYRADAPFPMFIGEALSVFRFLWEPWLLVFVIFLVVCGALPFWK